MLDGEVEGLDAGQITLVHLVLAAGAVGFGDAEEFGKLGHRALHDIDIGDVQRAAADQQHLAQPGIDQGEEHQAGD